MKTLREIMNATIGTEALKSRENLAYAISIKLNEEIEKELTGTGYAGRNALFAECSSDKIVLSARGLYENARGGYPCVKVCVIYEIKTKIIEMAGSYHTDYWTKSHRGFKLLTYEAKTCDYPNYLYVEDTLNLKELTKDYAISLDDDLATVIEKAKKQYEIKLKAERDREDTIAGINRELIDSLVDELIVLSNGGVSREIIEIVNKKVREKVDNKSKYGTRATIVFR